MAFLLRSLILAVALVVPTLLPAPLFSAPAASAEPPTFRVFALSPDIPDLLYDHQGRRIAISPLNGVFSSRQPVPANGIVALYREIAPTAPRTAPERVPMLEITLGTGGQWLVFLAASPSPDGPILSAQVADHSWRAHPPGAVRVFNFCRTQVALQIGNRNLALDRASSETVPYPAESGRLWVKAAHQVNGGWHLGLSQPQRIQTGTRATWIVLNTPYSADEPDPNQLFLRRLTETPPDPDNG